jgi:hypothetical protein
VSGFTSSVKSIIPRTKPALQWTRSKFSRLSPAIATTTTPSTDSATSSTAPGRLCWPGEVPRVPGLLAPGRVAMRAVRGATRAGPLLAPGGLGNDALLPFAGRGFRRPRTRAVSRAARWRAESLGCIATAVSDASRRVQAVGRSPGRGCRVWIAVSADFVGPASPDHHRSPAALGGLQDTYCPSEPDASRSFAQHRPCCRARTQRGPLL